MQYRLIVQRHFPIVPLLSLAAIFAISSGQLAFSRIAAYAAGARLDARSGAVLDSTDNPSAASTDAGSIAAQATGAGPGISPTPRTSRIAFASGHEGIVCAARPLTVCSQIYVMNEEGMEVTRLTNIPGSSHSPAFSPDGRKIAFVHKTYQQYEHGVAVTSTDIFLMNGDGTGVNLLVKDGEAPAFTPDGQQIAFAWKISPSRIYLVNVDGSNAKPITNQGSGGPFSGGVFQALSFSPNGSKMVFVCVTSSGYVWDICLLDLKSMETKKLTDHVPSKEFVPFSGDGSPAFSPDGSKIVFARDFRIHLMNADGTNTRQLSDVPGYCPTFSPDGVKIAFVCPPGQICIMNANGTGVTRLPMSGGCPSWR